MPTRQSPKTRRFSLLGAGLGCTWCVRACAFGTLLAIAACDPTTPPDGDGGTGPRDAGGGVGVTGIVEVQVRATDEGEADLEVGHLSLARVRARSDRGAAEDPVWTGVVLDVDGPPLEAAGVPATYGGVLLEPASTGCGAELTVAVGELRDVTVCITGWAPLDLRCASPVVLYPDDRIRIEAQLEMAILAPLLELEELETGDHVDRESHPALHEELVERWASAWTASCEGSTDSGDSGG